MTIPRDSGGGRGSRTPKPKKRKKPYTPPMPATERATAPSRPARGKRPDTAGNPNVSRPTGRRPDTAGNPRTKAPKPYSPPRHSAGDAATAGRAPTARAERFKKTPAYQAALRDAVEAHRRHDAARHLVSASRAGRPIFRTRSDVTGGELITGLGTTIAALGVGTYHDPVGVPTKTAKQLARALPAIPGGVYDTVVHPEKTGKEMVKGFVERTGKQSFKEKVSHIRDEGGLAYGADVMTVVPAGGVASKLATKVIKRGATAERAVIRLSGGVTKPKRSRGQVAEAISDRDAAHRAAKSEKQLRKAEAGGHPIDPIVRQAAVANRQAGRVVEVPARFPSMRQHRLVATQRGRAIYGLRHDQGHRVRAAGKVLSKLNSKERRGFYYAATLGIRTADQAREVLPGLAAKIREARARDGFQVTGSLHKSDMLPDIEKILRDPDAHFTPDLGDAIEHLRPDSMKAGMEDPGLTPGQRMLRRYAPLAHTLGMRRGENPDATAWSYVPGQGDRAKAAARAGHPPDIDADLVGLPSPEAAGLLERGDKPLALPRGNGELVPGASVAEAVARVANGDIPRARRRAGQGYFEERPGHRYFDESDAQFIRRMHGRMGELGLAKPLYFKSERYRGPRDFAAFTAGGKAAMQFDQRYRGENLKVGLQDTTPNQYIRGLARNIKRKHNWNLVADLLDQNALKEFGGTAEGSTVSALRHRLATAGVDFGKVAFWNPGVYRAMARTVEDNPALDRFARAEEVEASQIVGLNQGVIRVNHAGQAIDGDGRVIPEETLIKQSGWHVVPDAVLKELEAQMVPSGKVGRSIDIAKGKASRAILLTGNVPWLGFQVASNAAMATVATGGRALNPANWLGAARWWRELTPADRERTGKMLGLDATGADSHQVRMGAAANGDFVNAYRAFKDHPFWHTGVVQGRGPSISGLNPLEAMARADRGQTNLFRILAGYSHAKRDAYRGMGESMARADSAQGRIAELFQKPPAEQLQAIARDPQILERHAQAVNDWMGDYTTLTANERKVVNRAVMFMPYVRYSLRLLFWTMPVDHPIMSGVLASLGNLKADELAELFGEKNLPWNSGKLYFGSGGNLKSIDLKRANPLLSAPIDALRAQKLSQAVGIAPPFVGWLTDQLYKESAYTGKDWKTNGHPTPYGGPHPSADTRFRILANDVMGMMFPTRLAQATRFNPATMSHDERLAGPQGDDSLIFAPRPTHYKGTDAIGKLQKKFGARAQAFQEEHESLLAQLIPMLPQPDRSPAQAREQDILEKASQPKKKHKAKSGGYFSKSGGGGYSFK